jgi:hypothetical protein
MGESVVSKMVRENNFQIGCEYSSEKSYPYTSNIHRRTIVLPFGWYGVANDRMDKNEGKM